MVRDGRVGSGVLSTDEKVESVKLKAKSGKRYAGSGERIGSGGFCPRMVRITRIEKITMVH